MSTAAKQVVDAIATRLAGAATLVTTKRLHPLAESDLPAFKVFRGADDIETSVDGTIERHRLEVMVSGFVRAVDDVDDAIDALLAAGLAAIHGTQHAQFTVTTTEVGALRTVGDGEAALAAIDIRLRSTFHASPTDPSTLL